MLRLPPISTRTVTSFPYTTLVRSQVALARGAGVGGQRDELVVRRERRLAVIALFAQPRKHRGLLVALALRGADAFEALHLAGVVLHRVFPAAHGAGVLDRDVGVLDAGRVDQRRERAVVPGDEIGRASCRERVCQYV